MISWSERCGRGGHVEVLGGGQRAGTLHSHTPLLCPMDPGGRNLGLSPALGKQFLQDGGTNTILLSGTGKEPLQGTQLSAFQLPALPGSPSPVVGMWQPPKPPCPTVAGLCSGQ